MTPRMLATMVAVGLWTTALGADASAAGQQPKTLRAWDAYVSATEARIKTELAVPGGFLASDFTRDRATVRDAVAKGAIAVAKLSTLDGSGGVLAVPGGTIAHWRGAVFLPGVTLDALLHRLQYPDERGPHQEDVITLRVLDRMPDRMTLAMRLTRTKIVTATYDTEHVATYRRLGPKRASSKSVSTKIVEVANAGTASERVLREGEGRGFLWRMNSYWRYEEASGGVIVELESMTLSRGIPMGLAFVVEPLVDGVARESMTRTLESVRRLYSTAGPARAASTQVQ